MRYQKPVVISLSTTARAAGQDPLGCYAGDTPIGRDVCATGTTAGYAGCMTGSSADYDVCSGGSSTGQICAAGMVADVPDLCLTGPSDLSAPV